MATCSSEYRVFLQPLWHRDGTDPVSVLHEVGRFHELPGFPYPDIGMDNDGVLVSIFSFWLYCIAVWQKGDDGMMDGLMTIGCERRRWGSGFSDLLVP
jgi:hypothetical protein